MYHENDEPAGKAVPGGWKADASADVPHTYDTNETNRDKNAGRKPPRRKSPFLAGVLSLFMAGLGHVYAGQVKRGVLLYLGFLLMLGSLYFVAVHFWILLVLLILIFVYHGYTAIDAFLQLRSKPWVRKKPYDRDVLYIGIIIVYAFLVEVFPREQLMKAAPISFASQPGATMDPALHEGDLFAYRRLQDVEPGEVVIFRHPYEPASRQVFRAAGTPGDEVELKSGLAYVNGSLVDKEEKVQFSYLILTLEEGLAPQLMENYKVGRYLEMEGNMVMAQMTRESALAIAESDMVLEVRMLGDEFQEGELFPGRGTLPWSLDEYGPVYVPAKGEKIRITERAILLYGALIKMENPEVVINNSSLEINGREVEDYTFENDYYFVLGDNRHTALDSRYWGFLPAEYVQGKVLYVCWSEYLEQIGKGME